VAKVIYKPLGLLFGILGGIVAGAVFKRVWRAVANEDDAPNATDRDKGWGEVVTAAAAQGAIFAGVKAVVDRAGATAFARVTGIWPGSTT
jgi:predicted metal-dependent enzyme (double-stranded beta helix superfamily)